MPDYANKPSKNKSEAIPDQQPAQAKSKAPSFEMEDNRPEAIAQRKLQQMASKEDASRQTVQKKPNNTGLPDHLKAGIENLSGYSMDDVKVHYGSAKPRQLNAHAYAQGTDIHLGPGQEKHLPHEAWHTVQQKQGRVRPTMQMNSGVQVNDDIGLEKEADVMGSKAGALQLKQQDKLTTAQAKNSRSVQRVKIGKDNITTANDLATKLGLTEKQVIDKFNEKLDKFPAVDKGTFNNFLVAKKSRVRGGNLTDPDDFITRLANSYKTTYMSREHSDFKEKMDKIKQDDTYKDLIDPDKGNYLEDAVDDGASIKDTYSKTLACTLYAILELKPGFLGASNPEQLHYILRTNPKTKNYDNDPQVAQIRLAAGLKAVKPGSDENTVSKFSSKYSSGKYIIDPSGQAHTFVLAYTNSAWKKIDNDHPSGTTPSNENIRYYWKT